MIAINKNEDQTCRQILAAFFTKYPNARLGVEAELILKKLIARKVPMLGKPGGWAGGIIYATANQYRSSCGIPGFLNKESEEFFGVSMSTIYKRAWTIWESLGIRGF
ncbi:MAG: hypothetical protein JXB29_01505 [Sedimentisphaerales bacterium]|nr:hypothetical protein [Sedimentisphaerales bacterium]